MDLVLDAADEHILSPYVYPADWPEDWWVRQTLSLLVIVNLAGYFLYFSFSTLSFYTMFDHDLLRHPRVLQNQIAKEIEVTCKSIPIMSIPTVLLFLLEIRGYSRLYDNVNDHGWPYIAFSFFFFLFFTDMCIYWIHRWLHHPLIYKYVHKPHHRWIVPTPFASHAFHPVDGFLQSSPYHLFVFLFPLHKFLYMGLFVFVNFWTISIHDGNYKVPLMFREVINGAGHHTDHHIFFNYNYGQFFTLWDRIGKSYREPSSFLGDSPLDQVHLLDKKFGTYKPDGIKDEEEDKVYEELISKSKLPTIAASAASALNESDSGNGFSKQNGHAAARKSTDENGFKKVKKSSKVE